MEDMLVWMALHSHDCLDSEDDALILWKLPQILHPLAQLPGDDLPFTHNAEGIHSLVMARDIGMAK
eukprot:CAMPEP_0178457642 /NCGR_PEP_ID=MMETSP0689_2-20121128/47127_1 /TAXON_ID=160604 /ORGANISM="Amphidinium massartii, Strain CS-259" /LENGTH=65 /DNA_ID=CAMNT_0020083909 /DNA_START=108 /DNA_END=302 /DNA_ORIENTATION=+